MDSSDFVALSSLDGQVSHKRSKKFSPQISAGPQKPPATKIPPRRSTQQISIFSLVFLSDSSALEPADSMDSGVSGEAVDVALLLAPLPRDRIELFVAELIANHPDEFPHLLAMAHKPVDSHELSVFTQNTLNSSEFSPVEVLNEFSPWLERCQEYLKANHAKNSLIILDCISPPLLDWISAFLKENRQFSSDDEEFQDFEIFLGQLESCWQSAMKQIKIAGRYLTEDEKNSRNPLAPMPDNHEISSADLAGHFQHLGKFKAVVSGVFGPIFSDALREYKKKIEGPAANGKILGNDKKKQKTEEK